ncbi:MAG: hypothetical protein QXI60_03035 [Thermofilaceae archaeon]
MKVVKRRQISPDVLFNEVCRQCSWYYYWGIIPQNVEDPLCSEETYHTCINCGSRHPRCLFGDYDSGSDVDRLCVYCYIQEGWKYIKKGS